MKRRLTCSMKYFCLGAFLIFLGSVLLCGLGLTIVLPHEMTRDWPEVTCQVINSSYSGRICSCEYQARDFAMDNEQCLDSYPCLHIVVSYTVYGVPGSQQDPENGKKLYDDRFVDTKPSNISLFYDNDRHTYKIVMSRDQEDTPHNKVKNRTIIGHLYRSWEDEFFKTCTLHECGAAEWNINQVYTFQRLWGQRGHPFRCYYDPDDVIQVILERRPLSQMIHALLWPTMFLVIGLLIWLGLWLGCWQVDMEKYSQPNIDRTRGDMAIKGRMLIN
ncbi:hypothetical protein LSH36_545g01032 [Paralvinella palmiformis]|uniref:Uncharacterized protein n=1 Tax=Paralvinella palmiformis TaxID=53620 RepID=A0AAD9J6M3_9ANNE|nr:hypothetical protein LSH36_545g01032 [Paralvinella palmiformis]